MILKKQELDESVTKCLDFLMSNTKLKFSFESSWLNNIPNGAGIYAIFYEDSFYYIGETTSLKKRMKDVRRTYNHSFRKKLGSKLYGAKVIKNKFN